MSCLTILLAPGRFGPMTSFIERSSRTDRRWVASFICSEDFLVEAISGVEASCLRNIWRLYHTEDQDLRSSVTCWAMCGVLCAWKKCITPWITVVAIVQWFGLAASSSSVFCPSSEVCVTFQIEGILLFPVSDRMDEASLPLTKPAITINAVSLYWRTVY